MATIQNKDWKVQIDREVYNIPDRCRTGAQLLEIAGKTPVDQYQLYQKHKNGKVEKIGHHETVCFDDPGIEKFTTQKKSHTDGSERVFKFKVDREEYETDKRSMTAREILEFVGKNPYTDYQLYEKLKDGRVEKVHYDKEVYFDEPGREKFTTQKKSHTDGSEPIFKFKVDREEYETHNRSMTAKEILEFIGKHPYNDYQLYEKLKDGEVEKIPYEKEVHFDEPGRERFTTQKKKHQDGEKPRRDFKLIEEDEAYLDAMGFKWETITAANLNYVMLRGAKLPSFYSVETADIAIRIDNGYPRAQLDMAFFYPQLSRADKQSINNLTDFPLEGKVYQQWSRHRTPDNPWRDGIDSLATHIGFMQQWLEDEFIKKPHAI